MDFAFTDEQKMFQQAVRKFAEREVAPLVDKAEEKEEFPMELFSKIGELGYTCPGYPLEIGGLGLGKIGDCILTEELTRICSGIASGITAQSSLATSVIMVHGNEQQKQKYLIPAVQAKKIACFGLTEPNAGSDAAAIETTAKRDGNHYIVNGNKVYISNGPICDYISLAVSTDRSKGSRGISILIVDKDTPGCRSKKLKKIGHHSIATGDFTFMDCRVPVENLVGEEGKGFKYVLEAISSGRISHSARSVGLAQAALEASIEYANQRVQFGQPIGKFQAIAFKIARMATEIEAARWLLYRVAWLHDQGNECRKEAPMTKLFSSEVAVRVAEEAMRIHAGAGYMAESKVQRYFRDAILFPTTEGTNEIQQMVISRELGL